MILVIGVQYREPVTSSAPTVLRTSSFVPSFYVSLAALSANFTRKTMELRRIVRNLLGRVFLQNNKQDDRSGFW